MIAGRRLGQRGLVGLMGMLGETCLIDRRAGFPCDGRGGGGGQRVEREARACSLAPLEVGCAVVWSGGVGLESKHLSLRKMIFLVFLRKFHQIRRKD
jgi:hypothetical protein